MEFNKSNISKNEYDDFFIVIKKDTFLLMPNVNYMEKKSEKSLIKINYTSRINFQSKEYMNDSLTNIILNSSKIINSKGFEIKKDRYYRFKSLITIRNAKGNERVDM